ncbi:hypothetical protein [Rhodanobacter koreensis]
MGTSLFDALANVGMLGSFVLCVIDLLLGALLLCLAFRIVVGYVPSYTRSIAVLALTLVAMAAAVVVSGMLLPDDTYRLPTVVAVGFMVGAWAVDRLLMSRTGGRLGYTRAGLVQLVFMVAGFVLVMIFSAIMHGMH